MIAGAAEHLEQALRARLRILCARIHAGLELYDGQRRVWVDASTLGRTHDLRRDRALRQRLCRHDRVDRVLRMRARVGQRRRLRKRVDRLLLQRQSLLRVQIGARRLDIRQRVVQHRPIHARIGLDQIRRSVDGRV